MLNYPAPDYRLSPPEDRCRVCFQNARPGLDTCSPDCGAIAMQRDAAHDGRTLSQEAWRMSTDANGGTDVIRALAWVWYHWRSAPSAYELVVRKVAADLLVAELYDWEVAAWHAITNDASVRTLAGAMAIKHSAPVRDAGELLRVAA